MAEVRGKFARKVKAFVENPVTNLVKGSLLVLIGISDVSRTFLDDTAHGHLRVGHGLIIIGLFSVLDAVPHFISATEAGLKYVEFREQERPDGETGRP